MSISAIPLDEKMPSLFGVLLSWFPNVIINCSMDFFHETNARWQKVEQWDLENQKLK